MMSLSTNHWRHIVERALKDFQRDVRFFRKISDEQLSILRQALQDYLFQQSQQQQFAQLLLEITNDEIQGRKIDQKIQLQQEQIQLLQAYRKNPCWCCVQMISWVVKSAKKIIKAIQKERQKEKISNIEYSFDQQLSRTSLNDPHQML